MLLPGVSSLGLSLGVSGSAFVFNVFWELDLCTRGPFEKVMPRGRAGGVPGLGLSRERKLRLDFGVPPRERENLGVRLAGKRGGSGLRGEGVGVIVC